MGSDFVVMFDVSCLLIKWSILRCDYLESRFLPIKLYKKAITNNAAPTIGKAFAQIDWPDITGYNTKHSPPKIVKKRISKVGIFDGLSSTVIFFPSISWSLRTSLTRSIDGAAMGGARAPPGFRRGSWGCCMEVQHAGAHGHWATVTMCSSGPAQGCSCP